MTLFIPPKILPFVLSILFCIYYKSKILLQKSVVIKPKIRYYWNDFWYHNSFSFRFHAALNFVFNNLVQVYKPSHSTNWVGNICIVHRGYNKQFLRLNNNLDNFHNSPNQILEYSIHCYRILTHSLGHLVWI